jgi:hypothetical protein
MRLLITSINTGWVEKPFPKMHALRIDIAIGQDQRRMSPNG